MCQSYKNPVNNRMKDLILAFFFFVIAKNIRIMSIFCFHTGKKIFYTVHFAVLK